MKINKKFPCCGYIQGIMEEKNNNCVEYEDIPVYYSKSIRSFFIMSCPKTKRHIGSNNRPGYPIKFCPWCGTKFPKSLANKKAEIMSTEYDHDDACWVDNRCCPPEFQTDAWWKKRGL